MANNPINPNETNQTINLGEQSEASLETEGSQKTSKEQFRLQKGTVTERDIFSLAKTILLFSALIYILLAILNVSTFSGIDQTKMKDVWDYSKVFLNSIISLVLGLYFGAKKENGNKG